MGYNLIDYILKGPEEQETRGLDEIAANRGEEMRSLS